MRGRETVTETEKREGEIVEGRGGPAHMPVLASLHSPFLILETWPVVSLTTDTLRGVLSNLLASLHQSGWQLEPTYSCIQPTVGPKDGERIMC